MPKHAQPHSSFLTSDCAVKQAEIMSRAISQKCFNFSPYFLCFHFQWDAIKLYHVQILLITAIKDADCYS